MIVRLILGLVLIAGSVAIAARRFVFLARLIRTAQPSPGRLDQLPRRLLIQLTEVFGQKRLLKWSVPGAAHFITFWAFLILLVTIVEAAGALFARDFAFPFIGHTRALGVLEDLFATLLLFALLTFALIRRRNAPARRQRSSRFYGSHNRAAWLVLAMITLVVLTLFGYRGAQLNTGHYPWAQHPRWTFTSYAVAQLLHPLGTGVNEFLETFFILAQVAVVFGFLVLVVHSKHLHIFLAPINVSTKRDPDGIALGRLLPMMSNGQTLDFEAADPETDTFGAGKVEDFKWNVVLDLATCTECGRCQSQCPAWNTGKPLSPKLVIMDLRDHLFAKTPYLLGSKAVPADHVPNFHDLGTVSGYAVPESGYERIRGSTPEQATRPLVGTLEQGGVIDSGRAVVLHHLRRVRGAVPGRHRAHRSHPRHAPLPGPHRERLPQRSRTDAAQPGEQGQPLGHEQQRPRGLDARAALRGPASHRHHPR